jgi:hypothetical protein
MTASPSSVTGEAQTALQQWAQYPLDLLQNEWRCVPPHVYFIIYRHEYIYTAIVGAEERERKEPIVIPLPRTITPWLQLQLTRLFHYHQCSGR